MSSCLLALVEALGQRLKADREVSRLREGPGEVGIAIADIAGPLDLSVTQMLAGHAAAVGAEVPGIRKARDRTGLVHDGQSQDLSNPGDALEQLEFGPQLGVLQDEF